MLPKQPLTFKASFSFSKSGIFTVSADCWDLQLICYLLIFNMFVNTHKKYAIISVGDLTVLQTRGDSTIEYNKRKCQHCTLSAGWERERETQMQAKIKYLIERSKTACISPCCMLFLYSILEAKVKLKRQVLMSVWMKDKVKGWFFCLIRKGNNQTLFTALYFMYSGVGALHCQWS